MVPSERALDILAIGDPVLDVVVRCDTLPTWDDKLLGQSARQLAGGTEANAACAFSRLGLRAALFGDVGDGHEAAFLVDGLQQFGVSDIYLRRLVGTTCATAVVFVSDAGERAITYIPMHKSVDRWNELEQVLGQTRCIYTLPYNMVDFKRLSSAAQRAGTLVAVDIERAVAKAANARAVLSVGVDFMFFNEAGFRSLVDSVASLATATEFIKTTAAQVLVVTLGPQGAFAVDRNGNRAVHAALQANVVDTTGAGDTFNAAFLTAHLRGLDLQSALAQGCAAACFCIEAQGARAGLPTSEQVAALQATRQPRPTLAI